MEFREFYPKNIPPQAVLVLPNHLGSKFETDFTDRAQEVSEALGMLVVAYERPLPSSTTCNLTLPEKGDAESYIDLASQTGKHMDSKLDTIGVKGLEIIFSGNSAAALEAIMMVRSQTVRADRLIAADPVGIIAMERLEFARRWKAHERLEEQRKEELKAQQAAKENRFRGLLGIATKGLEVAANGVEVVNLIKRGAPDFGYYLNSWRSSVAYTALQDISQMPDFNMLSVYAAFVEHTFTVSPEQAHEVIATLNNNPRPETAKPFVALYKPNTYHSYVNDPPDFAGFVQEGINRTGSLLRTAA